MRTAAAPPFLLPDPDAVLTDEWLLNGGSPLPGSLEHWDPFTTTRLSRVVTVDLDSVRGQCRLGADAAFALTTDGYSSTTRIASGPPPTELGRLPGLVRATLNLILPGPDTGGRVTLRTRLVLRHAGAHPTPISPQIPGTVLWQDREALNVEGSAARFPVTAVDFSTSPGHPDNAAWLLEWNPHDLDQPLLGGLRLLINSSSELLMDTLLTGPADPRSQLTHSFLTYDIARTVITSALRDDDYLAAPHRFAEGTVGRMITELIESCWPGTPVTGLARQLMQTPARIDTALQAHLGTLT